MARAWIAPLALGSALACAQTAPFIASASAPSAYRLQIGGHTQFRYTMNLRDTAGDQTQVTNGFDTRRTKLSVRGNVISEDLSFYILAFFGSSDGSLGTEDIRANYAPGGGPWSVTWGQFKPPLLREELVSATRQLAMDRSLTNEVFNQDYAQGLMLTYDEGHTRLQVSLTDGLRTGNRPFTNAAESDVALTGRLEHAMGDRLARFGDFTSWRSAESAAVLVGVAGHWESAGSTASFPVDAPRRDRFLITADVSVEGSGWSLFGAVLARVTDPESGETLTEYGAVVQGSFFVTEQTELFARWDGIFPDEDAPSGGTDEFNTYTLGANHYFIPESHAAKLVLEATYFPDAQANSSSLVRLNSNAGLVTDANGDQVSLRAMMQLVF